MPLVPTILLMLTMAVLYWFPVRRWMSRWGATPSDLSWRAQSRPPHLAIVTHSTLIRSNSARPRPASARARRRS